MTKMKNPAFKDFFHVNPKLLPLKIHYFFLFGAFASIMNFMPVIAKEIGIDVIAVGIVYSTLHIALIFSNPIIGMLVDYFQHLKIFIIIFFIISVSVFSSVLGLPQIADGTESLAYVQVSYYNDSESLLNISMPFKRSCLKEVLGQNIRCEILLEEKNVTGINNTNTATYVPTSTMFYYVNESDAMKKNQLETYWLTFYMENHFPLSEIRNKTGYVNPFQCFPAIHQCLVSATHSYSVFSTYQFWLFYVFIVLGGMTSHSSMNLSSVACNEILGPNSEAYGRQRLFGTISCGLMCSLAGILNDLTKSSGKSFLSSLYLMIIFMAIDLITLHFIDMPKAHISTSMCRDIGKIFSSKEILVFALGSVFIGIFTALPAVYEFWFLEDMGASRTILGLSVAMQCLLGEVPFLFFAGWFVKNLGHFLCLVGVFAGFAFRFILYWVIHNPWFALPIDILHGVTYGLFHGTMVSFAKAKAPKGMEATLLGLIGGLCDGVGCSIGSFVSGYSVKGLGARTTFFTASIICFGCLFLYLVASCVFRDNLKELHEEDSKSRNE